MWILVKKYSFPTNTQLKHKKKFFKFLILVSFIFLVLALSLRFVQRNPKLTSSFLESQTLLSPKPISNGRN